MKTTDSQYDPQFAAYRDMMVEELRKKSPKRPPTTDQQPSTKAILERDPSQDVPYWARPIPKDWKRDHTIMRDIPPELVTLIRVMRETGHGNTLGQSAESSISPERREKAIEAFTYAPPAPLTAQDKLKKPVTMTPIKEYIPPQEPAKPKGSRTASLWAWEPFLAFLAIMAALVALVEWLR